MNLTQWYKKIILNLNAQVGNKLKFKNVFGLHIKQSSNGNAQVIITTLGSRMSLIHMSREQASNGNAQVGNNNLWFKNAFGPHVKQVI